LAASLFKRSKIRAVINHKKARPEVVMINFIARDYTILFCQKINTGTKRVPDFILFHKSFILNLISRLPVDNPYTGGPLFGIFNFNKN